MQINKENSRYWNKWYIIVVAFLVLQIIFYSYITHIFNQ